VPVNAFYQRLQLGVAQTGTGPSALTGRYRFTFMRGPSAVADSAHRSFQCDRSGHRVCFRAGDLIKEHCDRPFQNASFLPATFKTMMSA
jgi:hypothetical protein